MSKAISLFVLWTICIVCYAQKMRGKVVDKEGNAIVGVTVMLLQSDSTFIEVAVTDAEGHFSLNENPLAHSMLVQHVAFKPLVITDIPSAISKPITLYRQSQKIAEVVVKSNKPMVTVNDSGGLVFDVSQLSESRPVDNALDMIGELPGVTRTDDDFSIVGTSSTTIAINGRKPVADDEDMKERLASIMPQQVKRIEVYYSVPPQYGVKGAVINVVLEKSRSEKTDWNGSLYTALYQGRRYYQTGGVAFNIFQKRWQLGIDYRLGSLDKRHKEYLLSRHTVEGKTQTINMPLARYMNDFAHLVSTDFNYDFKNGDKLSIDYMFRISNKRPDYKSSLTMDGDLVSTSINNTHSSYALQTASAQYANHSGFTIGYDYVHYNRDIDKLLKNDGNTASSTHESVTRQLINKGTLYFNHDIKLGYGTVFYGFDASKSQTSNDYRGGWSGVERMEDADSGDQNEGIFDIYVGLNQKLGERSTLAADLAFQYFHAYVKRGGDETTLWRERYFAPNITYTYKVGTRNQLVFSLSSERSYPGFHVTSNDKTYYNTYLSIEGNPQVKPTMKYEAHLNYVLDGRNVFGVYAERNNDFFFQQLYQNPQLLRMNYLWTNFNHYNTFGLMAVLSPQWTKSVNSKFTFKGFHADYKGAVGDVSMHRKQLVGYIDMSNNIVLNKARTLVFKLSASYTTKTYEGYYDIPNYFTSSAALLFNPKNSGWHFTLKAFDLFNTQSPKVNVNYKGQNFTYRMNTDYRYVTLNVRYSFKGYKKKQGRTIDTSRMDK